MRFLEVPALITEDIEDPNIVDITEPITASISGTTLTIDGDSKVSGEVTITLTNDVTVSTVTTSNIKQPSIHKITIKTNGVGNFTYTPNAGVTASSVSTTTKTGSDLEILLITTSGGETYLDLDLADYVSPAANFSNVLTGFNVSDLTSAYGTTAKLYKPDGTLLTTVNSAVTGSGVNFGYTESSPGDVIYKLEVTDDLGRKSKYNLPRKWINYAMETASTPGFQKFALEGNEYTSSVTLPNLSSSSKARIHKTTDHGYMGIKFRIQGRNAPSDDWVDVDDTGENENADESAEFLAFGNYIYHRVWVKPTAKATTTVSSSNVVTLTLSNVTEDVTTKTITGTDPFHVDETSNVFVFEETAKIGTVPFTVNIGGETYTNAVTATTEEIGSTPNTDLTAAGPNMKHLIGGTFSAGYMCQASADGKYIAHNKTNDSVLYILKGDPVSGYTDYTTITYSQVSNANLVGSMSYDGKYIIIASVSSNSYTYEIWKNDESTSTFTKLAQSVSRIGGHNTVYKPSFVPRSGNYDFAITGTDNNNNFDIKLYKHTAGTDTWTGQTTINDPTNRPTGDGYRGYYSCQFTRDGKYLMMGAYSTYGGYQMYTIDWDANTAVFSGANYNENNNIGHSGTVTLDGKYVLIFHNDSNSRKIFKNNDAGDWSSATDVTTDFTFNNDDNDQGHDISFFGDNSEYFVSKQYGGYVRVYSWYAKKEVTLTYNGKDMLTLAHNGGLTTTSVKLYKDDVLYHTFGASETSVVIAEAGVYQAIADDTYYSLKVTVTTITETLAQLYLSLRTCFLLKKDGKVWYWGESNRGANATGNNTTVNVATLHDNLNALPSGIKQIGRAAVDAHCRCAITNDGKLYTWGYNGHGGLGRGNTSNYEAHGPWLVSTQSSNTFTFCHSSYYSNFALQDNGYLWSCGYNGQYVLGTGNNSQQTTFYRINLPNVIDFDCNHDIALALTSDGKVYIWGTEGNSSMGGASGTTGTPTHLTTLDGKNIVKVRTGGYQGYAISSDGKLYAWGRNNNYQIPKGSTGNVTTPTEMTWFSRKNIKIVDIKLGHNETAHLALDDQGNMYVWGIDSSGSLGSGAGGVQSGWPFLLKENIASISCGYNECGCIDKFGQVYTWGDGSNGQQNWIHGTNSDTDINYPTSNNLSVGSSVVYDGFDRYVLGKDSTVTSNVTFGSNTVSLGTKSEVFISDPHTYKFKIMESGKTTYTSTVISSTPTRPTGRVYPPKSGTHKNLTTSSTANVDNTWTIDGALYGSGDYKASMNKTGNHVSQDAYYGFNGLIDNSCLHTSSGNTTVAIQLHMPQKIKLTKYAMYSRNFTGEYTYAPKDWKVYGSNDNGTNWTELDSQTNQTVSAWGSQLDFRDTKREYTVTGNTKYFSSYKLDVTANGGGNFVVISQIEYYGDEDGFLSDDGFGKLTIDVKGDSSATSNITFHSNTYAMGAARDLYVTDTGEYTADINGSSKHFLGSKTHTVSANATELIWKENEDQILSTDDHAAGDQLGYSVSVDGNYAVVGAAQESTGGSAAGAAYIFYKSGTTWSQQAKLVASDAQASDQFGEYSDVSGDYVIVGAPYEDTGGSNKGAAYIFKRSGTSWTQTAKIQGSSTNGGDIFGTNVSIDGDYAIVGAYSYDSPGSNAGAAYIFKRDTSAETWSQQAELQGSDTTSGDSFGYNVCINGEYVIVGATAEDTGSTDTGAAYIFKRSGTTWSQQAKIQHSDNNDNASFGVGVSLDGDYCVVGAQNKDSGIGSAYIFKKDTGAETWTQEAKINASDRESGDSFGGRVSISGDLVIVSSRTEDTGGSNAGAAYIFERSGTTWTEIKKITASNAGADDQFGTSVAIDGTTAFVGAHYNDTKGSNAGAAYIFSKGAKAVPALNFDGYNKLSIDNINELYTRDTFEYTFEMQHQHSGNEIAIHEIYAYDSDNNQITITNIINGDATFNGSSRGPDKAYDGNVSGTLYQFMNGVNTWYTGIKLFTLTTNSLVYKFDFRHHRPMYKPGYNIKYDGVSIYSDTSNGGGATTPEYASTIYILGDHSASSFTMESVTIKKDDAAFATTTSNTVYIREAGTYTAEVKGSGAYVTEVSKVVSGTITPNKDIVKLQEILGKGANYMLGFTDYEGTGSLAFSKDGTRLALGAYNYNSQQGAVFIYTLSGGTYSEDPGMPLVGGSGQHMGYAINFNDDGTKIGLGSANGLSARVYERSSSGSWSLRGSSFGSGTYWTKGVVLDASGDRALGGASGDNTLKLFDWDGSAYTETASGTFYGGGNFGNSFDMTRDGLTVLGINKQTGNTVKVWNYSGGSWSQVGSDIDVGDVISLVHMARGTGTRFLVSDHTHNSNTGFIKLFEYSSGSWSKIKEWTGYTSGVQFGWDYSISDDGTKIIAGSTHDDTGSSGNDAGMINIFTETNGTWEEKRFTGDIDSINLGMGVTMSYDGTFYAAAAPYDDVAFSNAGKVWIYEYTEIGPRLTYDGKNKLTISGCNYADTSKVTKRGGTTYDIGTAKTMYIKETGDYDLEVSGSDKFAVVTVNVGSIDLVGATTKPIDFDGYNKLTLVNAGANAVSNVSLNGGAKQELGSATTYYIKDAGTYTLEMSGSNVFALSSNVVGAIVTGKFDPLDSSSTYSILGSALTPSTTSDTQSRTSLSNDGTRVLVYNETSDFIQVYEYSSGSWTQLGSDINCGTSDYVSSRISGDGNRFCFGIPTSNQVKVYNYSSGSWSQIGSTITGSGSFGQDTSLNYDGTRLMVGATGTYNTRGNQTVWQESGGSWTQLGSTFYCTRNSYPHSLCGGNVDINNDGTVVCAGGYKGHGGDNDYGCLHVWKYSGGSWTQSFFSQGGNDHHSNYCRLSGDGKVVMYGHDRWSSSRGRVNFHENTSADTWSQIGGYLEDKQVGDLSNDGKTVVVGKGDVSIDSQVYRFDGSAWVQLGSNLEPSSRTLSISSDGSTVATGDSTSGANKVSVYKGTTPSPSLTFDNFNKLTVANFTTTDQAWPPLDGTLSSFTVTNSNKDAEWTISGASYGNGTYKAKYDKSIHGSYHPGLAFDRIGNVAASEFHSGNNDIGNLSIEFPETVLIDSYELRDMTPSDSGGGDHSPTDWTFEGSNDGTTWVTLDTQSGFTKADWIAAPTQKFTINGNSTAYKHYRASVSAVVTTYLTIREMRFYQKNTRTGTLTDPSGRVHTLGQTQDTFYISETGDYTLDVKNNDQKAIVTKTVSGPLSASPGTPLMTSILVTRNNGSDYSEESPNTERNGAWEYVFVNGNTGTREMDGSSGTGVGFSMYLNFDQTFTVNTAVFKMISTYQTYKDVSFRCGTSESDYITVDQSAQNFASTQTITFTFSSPITVNKLYFAVVQDNGNDLYNLRMTNGDIIINDLAYPLAAGVAQSPSPALNFDGYNKLTLTNTDSDATSNIDFFSNTYEMGSRKELIISDYGTYYANIHSSNTLALTKKQITETAYSSTLVGVFHHGAFTASDYSSAYSTVSAAATAGHVYSDTSTGTYSWGTLNSVDTSTSGQTGYSWTPSSAITGNVLIVGGGGGGGPGADSQHWNSGGGGGKVENLTNQTISAGTHTIIVGDGNVQGSGGTTSSAFGTSAAGGGAGSVGTSGTSGSGNGPGSNSGYNVGGGGGDAASGSNAGSWGGTGGDGSNVSWLDGTVYGEQVSGKAYFGGGGYGGDTNGSLTNGKGNGVSGTGGGGTNGGTGKSGIVVINSVIEAVSISDTPADSATYNLRYKVTGDSESRMPELSIVNGLGTHTWSKTSSFTDINGTEYDWMFIGEESHSSTTAATTVALPYTVTTTVVTGSPNSGFTERIWNGRGSSTDNSEQKNCTTVNGIIEIKGTYTSAIAPTYLLVSFTSGAKNDMNNGHLKAIDVIVSGKTYFSIDLGTTYGIAGDLMENYPVDAGNQTLFAIKLPNKLFGIPELKFDGYNKLTPPDLEPTFTSTRLSDWDNNNQSKTTVTGGGDWPDTTMTHHQVLHNGDKSYQHTYDGASRDAAQLFTTVISGDWGNASHGQAIHSPMWFGYKFTEGKKSVSKMILTQPPGNSHTTGNVSIKYWDGSAMVSVNNQSPSGMSSQSYNSSTTFTFDSVSSQYWQIDCYKGSSNSTSYTALHGWQLYSGKESVSTVITKGSDSYDIGTASSIYINDTGTYDAQAKNSNTFIIKTSNTVSGSITQQTLFSTFSKKQTITGSSNFSGAWADQNGNSLSMNYAGTRAVIASGWGSGGNVYIYHKDSSGTWSLDTTLTAPSSISNFGHGVDMSSDGNRIFVIRGVYNTDAAGRIFVYDYSSGWSNTPSATLSEPSRGNGFARRGYCSPDGNTCGIVSTGGNDRVYTWKYSGGSWQTTPDYIETPSEGEDFGCGFSFNTDGTRMLVGAKLSDEGGADRGRAYICDYSSGWTISHDLAGQYDGENFGEHVRINGAGTRAAIGARYNDEGGTNRGRAYIWDRNSGTGNWSLTQDIASSVVSNNSDFGGDLFMNKEGDRVIIGASRDDTLNTNQGSVHVYDRQSNGQFTLVQTMNGESSNERFGFSIGSDQYGNYILIGAPVNNRVFFYQSTISSPPSLTYDNSNKLSLTGVTAPSSNLTVGTNTYNIGSATDVYIKDQGTYTFHTNDGNQALLMSNVVSSTPSGTTYAYSTKTITNIGLNKEIDSASGHNGQYTHGAQGNGEYNDLNFTKTILTNGYPTDFSVVGTNDVRTSQTLENGQWHSSAAGGTGGTANPYFRINLEKDYYVDNCVLHKTGTASDSSRFYNVRFQLLDSSETQIKEVNVGNFGTNVSMTADCKVSGVRYVKVVTGSSSGYTHYDEIRINGYDSTLLDGSATTPSQVYDNTKTITVSNIPSGTSTVGKIYKGATAYTIHATEPTSNVIIKNTGSYVSVFTTSSTAYFTNTVNVNATPTTTSEDNTIEDEAEETTVSVSKTIAFHDGTFADSDDPHGDGSITAAATAGHVYSDTATGTYTWGTLTSCVRTAMANNEHSTENWAYRNGTVDPPTAGFTTYKWTPPGAITNGRTLVVAGGGGGGTDMAGGGGAGGLLASTTTNIAHAEQTIQVGGPGSRGYSNQASNMLRGGNGADSSISGPSITAIGGGGGATKHNYNTRPAGNGGSGGGGSGGRASSGSNGGERGTGTAGQGFDGARSGIHWYPGGGGGAGEKGYGRDGSGGGNSTRGDGGNGLEDDILGTSYWWAGGGGGNGHSGDGGHGGKGGGGGGSEPHYTYNRTVGSGDTNGITNGKDGEGGTAGWHTNSGGSAGKHTGGGGGGGDHHDQSDVTKMRGGLGGSGIVAIKFTTQGSTAGIPGSTAVPSASSSTTDAPSTVLVATTEVATPTLNLDFTANMSTFPRTLKRYNNITSSSIGARFNRTESKKKRVQKSINTDKFSIELTANNMGDSSSSTSTLPVTVVNSGAGTQYTSGWTTGSTSSFVVPSDAPNALYYYCQNHDGMGGSISVTSATTTTHTVTVVSSSAGTQYTSGWTASGTPGSSGATSTFVAPSNAPSTLYYYCGNHSGMGGAINMVSGPVSTTFTVTVQSVSGYYGSSSNKYFIDGTQQATISLVRGKTYTFNNNASGSHPMYFATSSDGTTYTSGVTNGGTSSVTFAVPLNAPSTLYYKCGVHGGMGGTINILGPTASPLAVTVAGGKFVIGGVSQATLQLVRGETYVFNQENSTNGTHPLRLSTTSNGTHVVGGSGFYIGGTQRPTLSMVRGNTYTFDQTNASNGSHVLQIATASDGTQYTSGYTTGTFVVPLSAPDTLYYKSSTTAGMGGLINVTGSSTSAFVVTAGGGKFSIGGVQQASLSVIRGLTYTFDQTDSSNSTHVLLLSSTSDGTRNTGVNKYYISGEETPTLTFIRGSTYTFTQATSTNTNHPIRLSTTSNGTHASGSQYTSGWTTTGTPGSSGASSQFVVPANAPNTLYYYCQHHSGMGGTGSINVADSNSGIILTYGSHALVANSTVSGEYTIATNFDGTTSNLYVNGDLITQTTPTIASGAKTLKIGEDYNGLIKNLKFWNYAKSFLVTFTKVVFHYGSFDTVYGDADVNAAAAAGHVFDNTPAGTYPWGTITLPSTASNQTTYTWTLSGTITVDVLMVAGGGGGGGHRAGGGGAGGLLHHTNQSISGQKTIVVGNGGIGGTEWQNVGYMHGKKGYDTTFTGLTTADGGGGGRTHLGTTYGEPTGNSNGGSGGGGAQDNQGGQDYIPGNGTAGPPRQGYDGGYGYNTSGQISGGGGGAGGAGQNATNTKAGDGGIGLDKSSVFGTTYGDSGWFSSGGGGSSTSQGYGSASQGGGTGGTNDATNNGRAVNAQNHTGGGGGGGAYNGTSDIIGGSGGSGIVIVIAS